MDARGPLLVLSLIGLAGGAKDTWTRPQPQTLHSLMLSVEEKLHSFDNNKLDSTLRNMEQKLEDLQSTVRRQGSTCQEKLDKLERNLNSKDLKDELMVEKLSHKMRDILDTSYDRYSRRLGYTEERLEMSLKKVQMSIEGILNRIEKQQEDIQADVTETVTILEELKSSTATDDRLNSTQKAIKQHIQSLMIPSRDELMRISGSLDHIGLRLNNSLGMWGGQSDVPQSNDILSTLRFEINVESNKLTSKVNNMYNEMWRRMVSIESLMKDLGRLGNMTRQDLLEELRSLVPADHKDFAGDSQENFLEVALDALERKLQKLGRNIDDKMVTLTTKQDLVWESCFEGRMCGELESKLSQVLERMFDIFSNKIERSTNRTFNLDSLVMELMELEKTHYSQLTRTVSHNTNMVITLAKDSSDANKLLAHNITLLDDHFQDLHDEIENLSGKIFTENEIRTELKLPQVSTNNITEVKFFPLNDTEQTIDMPKKLYDVGVLKITTDNMEVLADKMSKSPENTSRIADSSIIQVITTISPNLTSEQIDSLLQVLNSSMSFDRLEAIIQNTEADSAVDADIIELYDSEPNRTNSEDDLTTITNEDNGEAAFSGENRNNFDEIDDALSQYGTLENSSDSTIVLNSTEIPETEINGTTDKTGLQHLKLSLELKDHIKVYNFLWKLKHGIINIRETREQLKTKNDSNSETEQLLFVLQKLCYGHQRQDRVTHDYTDNLMRSTLLLINKTLIQNTDFYDKIENICNTMTESTYTQTNAN